MPLPTNAPTAPPVPLELHQLQPKLAAEIGAGLLTTQDILSRYDLTPDQLKQIVQDPQFRNMVREFKRNWNDSLSAKDRVRLKAMLAIEEALPTIFDIVMDPLVSPNSRLDGFEKLAKLADAVPRKDNSGDTGPGFSININIPSPDNAIRPITIDAIDDTTDDENG